MDQTHSTPAPVDEVQLVKSEMEKMVSSYHSYIKKMTFGREQLPREETVRLAQDALGNAVLEVGRGARLGPCATVYAS